MNQSFFCFYPPAAKDVVQSNPKSVREGLMSRCANILACYRKNCASVNSRAECMKVLPLFVNSIIKSDAIAGCTDITTDDRSWLMQMLLGMDVMSTPCVLLSSANTRVENGSFKLTSILNNYLKCCNDWVLSVFGVNSPAQIDIDSSKLLLLDNPLSLRLRNLVEKIRGQRSRYMKLAVVRQRDTLGAVVQTVSGGRQRSKFICLLC
ncbi:Protein transport protein Sec24C [Holothuria leucospilota]|uniref:Protein transport protein Sec24C n=1 Tax=Holothuria leucospilota TaxID=206669 RepID=A0A9Q1BD64_HOLLE|nr:Protein transport protein Sec24C [Holothuria leucospilota]